MQNSFRYGAELIKAEKDESTGDWIVEGIASDKSEDNEGETLDPSGFDYNYFLSKGFLKWEHDKNPKNYIGEPMEARVTKDGFYIKGRLYNHAPLAKEAVQAMESLQKSNARRRLGFSVEGSIQERDPKNPKKILKALVRNVALTFNPVNDSTWARLAKSLSAPDALEFDLDKAMATGTEGEAYGDHSGDGSALREESLESDVKDTRKRRKKRLKKVLLRLLRERMSKSLDSPDPAELEGTLATAMEGLSPKEVALFTSFIDQNDTVDLLKSLLGGGTTMEDLKNAVGEYLEDLEKALDEDELLTEPDEDETTLTKSEDDSADDDADTEDEESATKKKVAQEDDEDEDEDEDDEDEDDEDEDDSEDEDDEAPVRKSLMDEMSEDATVEKALEVSEFLESLVETLSDSLDSVSESMEKSLTRQHRQASNTGKVMKALLTRLDEQDELIKSLQAAIENQPVGRRSVQSPRDHETIAKSENGTPAGKSLSKSQIVDRLVDGVSSGKVQPIDVTRFELTGRLPEHLHSVVTDN